MYNLQGVLFDILTGTSTISIVVGIFSLLILITIFANCLWRKSSKNSENIIVLKDPNTRYTVPLIKREEINYDTRRLRFGLPSSKHVLGMSIGQYINLSFKFKDSLVVRPYSPISSDEDKGYFELIVKVYFKNGVLDGSRTSEHFENMKIGDTIDVTGPFGRLKYTDIGTFIIKDKEVPPTRVIAKKINMIAGGVGITPMLQLIRQICRDANDPTELRLLFANQTEEDIILRDELEKYEREYSHQFKLWYTIDKINKGWQYSTGFVNEDMITKHLFPPGPDVFVLMCGPLTMVNQACIPALQKLGFKDKMYFSFS